MSNRLSQEKAELIASEYMTNGLKKVEALLSVGYSKHYASSGIGLKLYDNPLVKQAITKIQTVSASKTGYTIDQYLQELNAAIAHARALNQPSAEISGIIAKGRSQGFDKDNDMATDRQEELSEAQKQAAIEIAALSNRNKLKAV